MARRKRKKNRIRLLFIIIIILIGLFYVKKNKSKDNDDILDGDKVINNISFNIVDKSESDKDIIEKYFMDGMSKKNFENVLNHKIKDYGTTSQEATMFDSYSESIKNHDENG